MRTRWMLVVASVLVLALLPGALRAADTPGCAPATAVTTPANAPASEPALVAPLLPVWAAAPTQPRAMPDLPWIESTTSPLINSCVGCTFQLCQRLHSCLGCC